jgi:hypothetical protein
LRVFKVTGPTTVSWDISLSLPFLAGEVRIRHQTLSELAPALYKSKKRANRWGIHKYEGLKTLTACIAMRIAIAQRRTPAVGKGSSRRIVVTQLHTALPPYTNG